MGIYGALSTAVSGLQAQSYALENISGNIANSQTIAFKRVDTGFQDMVQESAPGRQTAGGVTASAQATNDLQGSITASTVGTNMALNGSGFFVVTKKTGESNNNPTFSGQSVYTRRGDFSLDKDGYLANGAGDYLEGLSVDPITGSVSGSVPAPIHVSSANLPAQPTDQIQYQLNLPKQPLNSAYSATVPGSDMLQPSSFLPNTAAASAAGTVTLVGTNAAIGVMVPGTSSSVTVAGNTLTFDYYDSGAGAYVPVAGHVGIDVTAGTNITTALGSMQTALQASPLAGAATATVGLNGAGKVQMTLASTDLTDSMSITDTTNATTGLGLGTQTALPTPATGPVNTISAANAGAFQAQSISGSAITIYSANGSPENVQIRWAKTSNSPTDTWNMYYMSNSAATGAATMWTKVPQSYTFGANGSLNPAVTTTTIPSMTINGVNLGNITVNHGTNGVTEFADANGTASVTGLSQNGYAAGTFVSVGVDTNGRVVASYSNNQQVAVAQVVTASFSAANALKPLDGGSFASTTESGSPILSSNGQNIAGASLEASNTDISTEFTKLIVTQQAYAAGAKIVTAADGMLQQALNMIR
ncbi:MAG: flagellar hook-basal body complex protein [Hyphomicrobiales bacterium]|nr:flagellar hook-basal body complex protein [Hyphomicrobiales bacterium]